MKMHVTKSIQIHVTKSDEDESEEPYFLLKSIRTRSSLVVTSSLAPKVAPRAFVSAIVVEAVSLKDYGSRVSNQLILQTN